jgi:hypothetical protein
LAQFAGAEILRSITGKNLLALVVRSPIFLDDVPLQRYLDKPLHLVCCIPLTDGIRVISFHKTNAREAKRYGKTADHRLIPKAK